jgi:hypothetical protein
MEAELEVLRSATTGFRPGQSSDKSRAEQLASPAPSGGGPHCDTCVVGKDCVCLSNVTAETTATINIARTPQETTVDDEACGLCSTGSCICKDLGIRDAEPQNQQPSTPDSPSQGTKRKRSPTPAVQALLPTSDSYPLEIDFTSSFTNALSPTSRREGIPVGGCGFCSDSTPCVCLQNTLPPLQSDLSSILPEVKVEKSGRSRVPAPNNTASVSMGCTGEPGILSLFKANVGTCLQCRMDPMSTLFCQTLSKKLETPVSSIRSTARQPKKERKKEDTFLPCSAVYQTLSRHHNFNKMSLEVIVDGLAKGEHRGMEFAVGGVQGILREMDKGEISQDE